MNKKIIFLSLLILILVLCFSAGTITAFASDDGDEEDTSPKTYYNYVDTLSKANMVNYNTKDRLQTYEYFDMNCYPNRNLFLSYMTPSQTSNSSSLNNDTLIEKASNENFEIQTSTEYIQQEVNEKTQQRIIIGGDDRTRISNTRDWPYRGTVYLEILFSTGKKGFGTGFMMGPNLLVTAAHNVYDDVTNDNKFNPEFAVEVDVYAGINGESALPTYQYYAESRVISIQKEYYLYADSEEYFLSGEEYADWAVIELDRNLGNETGYYGKIENWHEVGSSIYSYGYPNFDDNDIKRTMWEAHGTITGEINSLYLSDIDNAGGQSGSPIFMTHANGNTYVCGILIGEYGSMNCIKTFNSFIYHYLNSFVCYHNILHRVATILPTDYGFGDAYPTSDGIRMNYRTHKLSNGFTFKTRRYRTGYIHNEYVVMSPFRVNINEAFIEYTFDFPVSYIKVYLCHWRSLTNEWTSSLTCDAVVRVKNGNDYQTVFDLIEADLPRSRVQPTAYTIVFDNPVYSFEFYMKSKQYCTNESNRGRVCIGTMEVFSTEGNY